MDARNLEELSINPSVKVQNISIDPWMKESLKGLTLQKFGIPPLDYS